MGILDSITSMAGQFGAGDKAAVGGGLADELQSQPNGVGGLLSAFKNNGLGNLVQSWAGGQTQPANPEQVEQGLGGTGIIDRIAGRTGMSPTMVKMGLAVVLPMVIHHFVSNGHVTAEGQPTGTPPEQHGGILQSVLGKLL